MQPSTYDILREAVKPENRQAFADHVVSFVQNSQLDGVDFDWEVRKLIGIMI